MDHDFNCQKTRRNQPTCERLCATDREKNCTDINSLMDYFQRAHDKWSCCSNSDFANLVNAFGKNFCLHETGKNKTETKAPATRQPPTKKPTFECESTYEKSIQTPVIEARFWGSRTKYVPKTVTKTKTSNETFCAITFKHPKL